MSRWSFRRFASLLLILVAMPLASCGPPAMLPAQPPEPQPEYRPAPPPPVPVGPPKVALLVPLSGPNGKLGKAMLDAAQLALFDSGAQRLTLLPRDTQGTPSGARRAARSAIREHVRLILGPLLESEVAAVKPLAEDAHVPVIAFSTATDLAGGDVFLIGFLPREEVVRIVAYARDKGHRRFAALVPDSAYGRLMAQALRRAVSSSGGEVVRIVRYQPGAGDLRESMQRLLASESVDSPNPPFDALMLPEGGSQLDAIAGRLGAAGLDMKNLQLLGSGLWDEPDIGHEQALVGGWFAAPAPAPWRGFAQRFQQTYGYDPPRLASLAYDATALAAVLSRGEGGQPFSREAILNPSGFSGVDGLFRFTPDGLVDRGLAVLQVEPQGNVVVSPAPRSFANLGY